MQIYINKVNIVLFVIKNYFYALYFDNLSVVVHDIEILIKDKII